MRPLATRLLFVLAWLAAPSATAQDVSLGPTQWRHTFTPDVARIIGLRSIARATTAPLDLVLTRTTLALITVRRHSTNFVLRGRFDIPFAPFVIRQIELWLVSNPEPDPTNPTALRDPYTRPNSPQNAAITFFITQINNGGKLPLPTVKQVLIRGSGHRLVAATPPGGQVKSATWDLRHDRLDGHRSYILNTNLHTLPDTPLGKGNYLAFDFPAIGFNVGGALHWVGRSMPSGAVNAQLRDNDRVSRLTSFHTYVQCFDPLLKRNIIEWTVVWSATQTFLVHATAPKASASALGQISVGNASPEVLANAESRVPLKLLKATQTGGDVFRDLDWAITIQAQEE